MENLELDGAETSYNDSSLRDVVFHAVNGDSVNLKSAIDDIMNERASAAIEDIVSSAAATLFNRMQPEQEFSEE